MLTDWRSKEMMKALVVAAVMAVFATSGALAQSNGNGNGAKVGKQGFLLNVIAFENCPAGDFQDSQRHMIAVQANFTGNGTDKSAKVNKIFLRAGEDFWVQDGNACDKSGGRFELPITAANCPNCGDPGLDPTFTEYEVRARLVGKPGGSVTVTSCVQMSVIDSDTLDQTLESFCSVGENNVWVETRTVGSGKKQSKWDNVSTKLLTVCIDTSDDGVEACDERIGLFDSQGTDYWWNWDTRGRPHVQLVFFPADDA
jgi:hypothetical protein